MPEMTEQEIEEHMREVKEKLLKHLVPVMDYLQHKYSEEFNITILLTSRTYKDENVCITNEQLSQILASVQKNMEMTDEALEEIKKTAH